MMIVGDVKLCKGYAENKSEEELKRLWLREHEDEILPYIQIEVLDGGEKKDVLVGGIKV